VVHAHSDGNITSQHIFHIWIKDISVQSLAVGGAREDSWTATYVYKSPAPRAHESLASELAPHLAQAHLWFVHSLCHGMVPKLYDALTRHLRPVLWCPSFIHHFLLSLSPFLLTTNSVKIRRIFSRPLQTDNDQVKFSLSAWASAAEYLQPAKNKSPVFYVSFRRHPAAGWSWLGHVSTGVRLLENAWISL